MNIYALAGHKVRFTGKGGYDWDKGRAKEKLNVGEIYTIHHTEVSRSRTDVYLVDISSQKNANSLSSRLCCSVIAFTNSSSSGHLPFSLLGQ